MTEASPEGKVPPVKFGCPCNTVRKWRRQYQPGKIYRQLPDTPDAPHDNSQPIEQLLAPAGSALMGA